MFSENHYSTIGVDFKIKSLELDGKKVKLQVWDTAGQERFRSISKAAIHGAQGVIIVYDITNKKSFEAIEEWYNLIGQTEKISELCTVMVANKIDLADIKEVSDEEAEDLAHKLDIPLLETCAKNNTGIEDVFIKMAESMKEKQDANPQFTAYSKTIPLSAPPQGSKIESGNGCC